MWDAALDRDALIATTALQNLYREMTRPSHRPNLCPKGEVFNVTGKSVFEHYIITNHLPNITITIGEIVTLLTSLELILSLISKHFRHFAVCSFPEKLHFLLYVPFVLYIADELNDEAVANSDINNCNKNK